MAKKRPYWTKVIFIDFVSHFRKLSPEEIVKDIQDSMDAVESDDRSKECFGKKMLEWADARREVYKSNSANGSKGGIAKKANLAKKPEQLVYGKFENVFLAQDEYNDLATMFGNINELNSAIDSLSAKLEDGSQESSNHYATLAYWAQCREHNNSVAESQPRKKNWEEVSMENYNNAMAMIEAKYGK